MGASRVLVVDDDPAVGQVLSALLRQAGHTAGWVASGGEALQFVERKGAEVVISDVRMPGMDGMALLRALKDSHPDLPVVMLTAHGTVELAVEAMKLGAADFLLKPFDREEVLYCVDKALASAEHAARRPPPAGSSDRMIGDSPVMREVAALIARVSPSQATVLLTGETGTGKEVAARALHRQSDRHKGPFVAVHCAALPETLLESELFGHEKGAFTGAVSRKPGRVELAEHGTLFLDEIGEVSPAIQAKLLRLLQEREYQAVGATQPRKADVRFVAATHRDLKAMVADGSFREDLYYRLAVLPIELPPLRERRSDIPALADAFLARCCAEHGRSVAFAPEAVQALVSADWPGNVRELQNLVERLTILCERSPLGAEDVARQLSTSPRPRTSDPGDPGASLKARLQVAERDALLAALASSGNNRTLAARLLGISRRTLYNKLEEHALA